MSRSTSAYHIFDSSLCDCCSHQFVYVIVNLMDCRTTMTPFIFELCNNDVYTSMWYKYCELIIIKWWDFIKFAFIECLTHVALTIYHYLNLKRHMIKYYISKIDRQNIQIYDEIVLYERKMFENIFKRINVITSHYLFNERSIIVQK